jgi:hypothetical protein
MTVRFVLVRAAVIAGFAGAVACATVPGISRAAPLPGSFPADSMERASRALVQTVGDRDDDEDRGGGGGHRGHGKHHRGGGGGGRQGGREDD